MRILRKNMRKRKPCKPIKIKHHVNTMRYDYFIPNCLYLMTPMRYAMVTCVFVTLLVEDHS